MNLFWVLFCGVIAKNYINVFLFLISDIIMLSLTVDTNVIPISRQNINKLNQVEVIENNIFISCISHFTIISAESICAEY